jgi:hypothetical protein
MKIKPILLLLCPLILCLSACQTATPNPEPVQAAQAAHAAAPVSPSPTPTITTAPINPSATPQPALPPRPTPTNAAPAAIGPEPQDIPAGYNPLTGLPVLDPATLNLPAVLVSITNFPPSARPQAGLSFSPWVYEIYIAEGMTRYLATFYGDFPILPVNNALPAGGQTGTSPTTGSGTTAATQSLNAEVGPVRSGRLAYVYIRDFFQDSCLVYASATEQLRARLRGCAMVFGDDANDINSAMLDVTRLQKIAEQNQRDNLQFNYSGSLFTPKPRGTGLPASQLDMYTSYLNQGRWQYDPTLEAFLKFDDFADGSGRFTPATDRLNGRQLAFSNVILLFAEHTVLNPYIIDVKLGMGERGRAIIFRDGQKFDATWSTVAGEYEKTSGKRRPIHFEDAEGNPFALKPGQTWVHIITPYSVLQDKGQGNWYLRFYAPAGSK